MPLFVVSVPSGRQVIVNAGSVAEAQQIGGSFVGGPAQARPATDADVQTIALLGPAIKGDTRPAFQSDPAFVASFGFPTGGGAAWYSINIPGAGVRLFRGSSLDAARLVAYTDLTTKWGLTGDQVSSVLAGMTVAGGPGPKPGGAKSSELAWGPPQGFTFDDKGGGRPSLSDLLNPRDLVNALFRRGLGARIGGMGDLESSIVGRAALGRQPAFENVFGFQSGLAGFQSPSNVGGVETNQNQAFEDFVRNTSGGMLGQQAARAFRVLSGGEQGAVPDATAAFRRQFGGANEDQANQLAQLVGSALSAGVSPLALNLLRLPSGEDLRSRFIAETGGGPETNFIKFLQENFPLASTIR